MVLVVQTAAPIAAAVPILPSVPIVMVAIAAAVIAAVVWLVYVQRAAVSTILLKIDSRGWLAIGNWLLVLFILALMAFTPDLRKDDLFKMIAQGLVMSGFINLVLAFYFTASSSKPGQPPVAPVIPRPAPEPATPAEPE